MTTTIAVTSRWQIHIPKSFRKVFGQEKPGKVQVTLEKDKLIIQPVKSRFLDLAGKYEYKAKKKKIDIDNIRDYIDYSDL